MKCEDTLLATYEIQAVRCEQQQRPAFHNAQSECASSLFFCFQDCQRARSRREHPVGAQCSGTAASQRQTGIVWGVFPVPAVVKLLQTFIGALLVGIPAR